MHRPPSGATPAPRMHLLGFLMHTPINHMMLGWANQDDNRLEAMRDLKLWQDLAKTLERGKFDGIFFADVPAVYDMYKGATDEGVRYGASWPSHDPLALIGAMVAATEHIGFAPTVSVSSLHPYLLVRSISTLDYLSRGRMGWNVVTGHARSEHRALGLEQLEHDERYDRAEEYMQICYALWDGIPPDAIIMDRKSGVMADPGRIRRVDFEGKYLRCQATPAVFPSPQGRPVIFQAGSSGRGQQFAVDHADVIFALQPEPVAMASFVKSVRDRASAIGRNDVPVFFGFQPFIGGTEREAIRQRDELVERIPFEAALSRISGTLGVDLSTLDLDKPLEELQTQASRGLMGVISKFLGDANTTIRQAVERTGSTGSIPQLIGTPEQIADRMEMLWRESGCAGFNVTPPLNPGTLTAFVDEVVPILQKRGIFREEYTGRTFKENLLA